MWSVWEEVESFERIELCAGLNKELNIANLGDWVARKVDDFLWFYLDEFFDEFLVAAGTWRVENDDGIRGDIVERFFRFSEDWLSVSDVFAVFLELFIGGLVDFDEC